MIIGPASGPGLANDYAGDTTINGAGGSIAAGLKIGNPDADNIMPHGSTGSFSGGPTGNVILNSVTGSTRSAVFDLNGSQQTINGLSNTASDPLNNFVQSSEPGGVLTLGDSNATATFAGVLRDNDSTTLGTLAITKIGTGTQTFTEGSSNYTGRTRVLGGSLSIDTALTSNAGIFNDAADVTIGSTATLNLNFNIATPDLIDSLYFGGSPQLVGTYGRAGPPHGHVQDRSHHGRRRAPSPDVGLLYGDYDNDGDVDAADYVNCAITCRHHHYAVERRSSAAPSAMCNTFNGGRPSAAPSAAAAGGVGRFDGRAGAGRGCSAFVAMFAGTLRGRRGRRGVA